MRPIDLESPLPHDSSVATALIEALSRFGAAALLDAADPGPAVMFGASNEALLSTALAHLIKHDRRERLQLSTVDWGDTAGAIKRIGALLDRWTTPESWDLLVARHEIYLESTRRPVLAGFIVDWRMGLVQHAAVLATRVDSAAPRDHAIALAEWMDGVLLDRLLHPDQTPPSAKERRQMIRQQVEAR